MQHGMSRRGFLAACLCACAAYACGGEEGTLQTIDVTVTLSPISSETRDVTVECFERDPMNATAEATKLAGQQIVGITARGESRFKVRVRDDMEYYFTARPDPALRCGADYTLNGDPSVFRGANVPTMVELTLSSKALASCQ